MWLSVAHEALSAVEAYRTAALICTDKKVAGELLEKSEALYVHGTLDNATGRLGTRDDAVKAWEHEYGSMDDPAVREKVYQAAAALRKLEIDTAEQAAKAQMRSSAAVAKLTRRNRRRQ